MKRQIFCWTILFFAIVGLVLLWLRPRQTKTVMVPPPATPQIEAEKAIFAMENRWMQGIGDGSDESIRYAIWDWRTNVIKHTWKTIHVVSNVEERIRLTIRCIEATLALPLDIYGEEGWLRGDMIENKGHMAEAFIWDLLRSGRREDVGRGWHYLIEKTKSVMGEVLECDRKLAVLEQERRAHFGPNVRDHMFISLEKEKQQKEIQSYRGAAVQSQAWICRDLFFANETNRVLSVFPSEQRDEMIRQLKVLFDPLDDYEKRYLSLLPQKKVNAE